MIKIRKKEIRYKSYGFGLHSETFDNLKKLKGGLTWNKFFENIIHKELNIVCNSCGTYKNLERHHIVARKDGGSDEGKNLMYLCADCHRNTESWGHPKK